MPCHPSAACRRSRPDKCASVTIGSVAPSRCCTGDRRTTCGCRLGIQNRDCRSGGVSGSQGKSQTPSLRECFQLVCGRLLHAGNGMEVAMIILMATKILPSEAGGRNSFRVPVSRRRTPINAKHGAPPYSRTRKARPDRECPKSTTFKVAGIMRNVVRIERTFIITFLLNTFDRFYHLANSMCRYADGAAGCFVHKGRRSNLSS